MSGEGHSSLREAGAAGGSLGLSGLSAALGACCAGPWAVTLFGISGAIAIARWESYRFYLLVPAVGLLAWAAWREGRRPGSRLGIRLVLAAAFVVLIASAFLADIVVILAQLDMIGG
jgi:hypothetical protein